jgi:hypothetical protein
MMTGYRAGIAPLKIFRSDRVSRRHRAAENLQVGTADAAVRHADEYLVMRGFGRGDVRHHQVVRPSQDERLHAK